LKSHKRLVSVDALSLTLSQQEKFSGIELELFHNTLATVETLMLGKQETV